MFLNIEKLLFKIKIKLLNCFSFYYYKLSKYFLSFFSIFFFKQLLATINNLFIYSIYVKSYSVIRLMVVKKI